MSELPQSVRTFVLQNIAHAAKKHSNIYYEKPVKLLKMETMKHLFPTLKLQHFIDLSSWMCSGWPHGHFQKKTGSKFAWWHYQKWIFFFLNMEFFFEKSNKMLKFPEISWGKSDQAMVELLLWRLMGLCALWGLGALRSCMSKSPSESSRHLLECNCKPMMPVWLHCHLLCRVDNADDKIIARAVVANSVAWLLFTTNNWHDQLLSKHSKKCTPFMYLAKKSRNKFSGIGPDTYAVGWRVWPLMLPRHWMAPRTSVSVNQIGSLFGTFCKCSLMATWATHIHLGNCHS